MVFRALFILVLLISGCASVPSDVRYAVVHHGAISMKKLPVTRDGLTTYPWLDPDETFFSACGFAEITFRDFDIRVPIHSLEDKHLKTHTYRYMTDEWCDIGRGLLEKPKNADYLIAYRVWRGMRYEITSVLIFTDADGRDYMADLGVVTFLQLADHLADVKQTFEGTDDETDESKWLWGDHTNTGCFGKEEADRLFKTDEEKANLVEVDKDLCFRRGVFIEDLLKPIHKRAGIAKPER